MARREFSTAIRTAVVKRATRDGIKYCEKCKGLAKRHQIDHIIPDALGGEPVLANAMLICQACWEVKNPKDTKDAAQAKRREAIHLGSKKPTTKPLHGPGFQHHSTKRTKHPIELPPRRAMFR